ncbi:MAG: hypothetical protein ACR2KH_08450 [Sphingomicrobium sp.]
MLPDPPNPSPDPSPDRPPAGQEVKTVFTIGEPERYASGMVIFASLALATAALAVPLERVEPQAVASARQAQATVTILPAARLRFSDIERDQRRLLRESVVRGADGSVEVLKLVEFQ